MKPPYLTATVVGIAKTIFREEDWSIAPILADAMQDAGYEDQDFLAWLRGPKTLPYPNQRGSFWEYTRRLGQIANRDNGHDFLSQEWECLRYLQAHQDFTKNKLASLLQQAKEAYHLGKRSKGYWLKERANLIVAHPGFVEAIVRKSLKGDVAPGMIWIKPSARRQSRKEKWGRALTLAELLKPHSEGEVKCSD